jgi:hypothetical protein
MKREKLWEFYCSGCEISIYLDSFMYNVSEKCVLDCPICNNPLKKNSKENEVFLLKGGKNMQQENNKLYCVRVFETDAVDRTEIANRALMFTVQKSQEEAQQHAIKTMQEKTGNELWSVAEAQPIEMVEGWAIKLEASSVLHKIQQKQQCWGKSKNVRK